VNESSVRPLGDREIAEQYTRQHVELIQWVLDTREEWGDWEEFQERAKALGISRKGAS